MRRAFILVAVLLVTVALAAGLLAMLTGVRGQSEAVFAIAERHAQRHAARSAAYAIAAEIGQSRVRLLAGGLPEIDDRRSIIRFEGEPGWEMAIISDAGQDAFRPLSGGLDVHEATAESIEKLVPGAGDRIVAGRPYRTPGQLREVLGEFVEEKSDISVNAERFTLLSIDPPLRSGAGGPAGSAGEPRAVSSSGVAAPIGLSAKGSAFAAAIMDGSWRPSSLGHILREAEVRGVPQEDWDLLLDWVAVGEAEPRRGLVDLNQAPMEVLAAIPGIDESLASALVDRRGALSETDRAGLSWPVRDGLVPLAQYADFLDRLTVRSMQIGVRFRVEREELDSANGPDTAERSGGTMTFEAIVDASGERARLVYLREITYLSYEAGEQMPVEADELADPEQETEGTPASEPEPPSEDEPTGVPSNERVWGRFAVEVAS